MALLQDDPWRFVTPGMVYHALKKRGQCCGCFPNVVNIISETTAAYHRMLDTPAEKVNAHLQRLFDEHERFETIRRHRKVATRITAPAKAEREKIDIE
ncbi:(2Fe-2S)-binding protein [Tepidamorphus sp. 3E244]|uniref:(2Fe-2S)-binding protein n=1 Tax=Tepidamorphus sp. 3E244 TaxID=3385498 RepID=UPI0038FD3D7F